MQAESMPPPGFDCFRQEEEDSAQPGGPGLGGVAEGLNLPVLPCQEFLGAQAWHLDWPGRSLCRTFWIQPRDPLHLERTKEKF